MKNKKISIFLIFITAFSFLPVYGQNITAINQTLVNVRPLAELPTTLNVFFPILLMVCLAVFMAGALKNRFDKPTGIFFSLTSFVFGFILSLIFLGPIDFTYTTTTTNITIEEIEYLDGNFTYNTIFKEDSSHVVIIPNDAQFRFIFSSLFIGLAFYNALFAILIFVYYPKDRRP